MEAVVREEKKLWQQEVNRNPYLYGNILFASVTKGGEPLAILHLAESEGVFLPIQSFPGITAFWEHRESLGYNQSAGGSRRDRGLQLFSLHELTCLVFPSRHSTLSRGKGSKSSKPTSPASHLG